MVLNKNGHFSNFFFSAIQARKMSFSIFQSEKTLFQAVKTKRTKSRKIDILPKGLTHGFCPKNGHFSNFFFLGNIGQENVFFQSFFFQAIQARKKSFTIFQREKTPFYPIKTRCSKSRKIDIFFKGVNPWFWSKNGHFSTFVFQAIQARKMSSFQGFFLGNIGQEKVFYDFLERKNAFVRYKNKSKKVQKVEKLKFFQRG